MIPDVMYAVTTREFRFMDAILRGYACLAVKGESYPGIIPTTDAVTKGILYFDVDELSLERLDAFEGNLYQRTMVRIETEEKEIRDAETYVIKPEYRGYLSWEAWDVQKFIRKDLETFLETFSGFRKTI